MQTASFVLSVFDTVVILAAAGLGGRAAMKLSKAAKQFKGFGASMGGKR
jgi:hypothetical protein